MITRITDRIAGAYPLPWHIEAESNPDRWQIWDNAGHVVAETTGIDADRLNDKAVAAFLSCAMDMYLLIRTLDRAGELPEKTATGYHAQNRFDAVCSKMLHIFRRGEGD